MNNEWIKCSDRMPEKEGRYLVVVINSGEPIVYVEPYFMYPNKDGVKVHCDRWLNYATHWMALPELPEAPEILTKEDYA